MTGWIGSGVIAWLEETRFEDETVLVYFKGVSLTDMAEGLIAQHRPPFAQGSSVGLGEWGVIVHHMYNGDDFDLIDYRKLCPAGAELVVFEPNPCIAKAHGPKAYHYRSGQVRSCIDYENPGHVGEYWPNELASLITTAGLGYEDRNYEERLTQLISDHLGLPPLDRRSITVDRNLIASYF
ncbi:MULTISPECIES: hypothetical protein [unclassified Streptomyces]|uniref:hypothetical protein n=1 Tax=unclassified Streptomyces TaxID=2593676 RepID=UPI002E2ACC7C|nr:hypothetical protein [Streptomyces sp. NBC_01439]